MRAAKRREKRRAEKGRRGVWGGVVEDGEAPRGGANAGEQHLVDKWFKGWLGGVCCMEWLGGGTMSVFGQCPIGASMALPYLSDR